MAFTKVEMNTTIPGGTNILVVWPRGTIVPQQSVLNDVAGTFGDPFVLTYFEKIYGYQHVGVTLDANVTSTDVFKAFSDAAAGNCPMIVALDADYENIVDNEQKAMYFKKQVKAVTDGTIDLITPPLIPATSPLRYVLYIAGGIVILGGGYWLYTKLRGRKRFGK